MILRSVPELSKNTFCKLKYRYVNFSKHRMCKNVCNLTMVKITASPIDSIPLKNRCYLVQDF